MQLVLLNRTATVGLLCMALLLTSCGLRLHHRNWSKLGVNPENCTRINPRGPQVTPVSNQALAAQLRCFAEKIGESMEGDGSRSAMEPPNNGQQLENILESMLETLDENSLKIVQLYDDNNGYFPPAAIVIALKDLAYIANTSYQQIDIKDTRSQLAMEKVIYWLIILAQYLETDEANKRPQQPREDGTPIPRDNNLSIGLTDMISAALPVN